MENHQALLSDKSTSANKMKLKNQEEITEGDFNTAKVFNIFFSKISSNLNIMEYSKCELLANNISDPVLK